MWGRRERVSIKGDSISSSVSEGESVIKDRRLCQAKEGVGILGLGNSMKGGLRKGGSVCCEA